jgi:hypothetical protein
MQDKIEERAMNLAPILGATAIALALAAAVPAEAKFTRFEGEYTVTFFDGPDHIRDASHCIDFTYTGQIGGFTNSGHWISTDVPAWGGYYVVDGKQLRWLGVSNYGFTYFTNFYNTIKDGIPNGFGGFDEWKKHKGIPVPMQEGATTLIPGCNAPIRTRGDGVSPSG